MPKQWSCGGASVLPTCQQLQQHIAQETSWYGQGRGQARAATACRAPHAGQDRSATHTAAAVARLSGVIPGNAAGEACTYRVRRKVMKVNKTPSTAAARQLRGLGRAVTISARLFCARCYCCNVASGRSVLRRCDLIILTRVPILHNPANGTDKAKAGCTAMITSCQRA
jgi:hypothetical protein